MSIRWDPLLTRALARELDRELDGARLRALRLDARTRDAVLLFRDRTLVWRLHPERGYPEVRGPIEPEPTDLRLRARVRRVYAPPDERVLHFELVGERPGSGGSELVLELLGNRLNAVVVEGTAAIVRHALRTREGARVTRVGHPYLPPEPTNRAGAEVRITEQEWMDLLAVVPPPDRPRELTRTIAWTSPLNAGAFLGNDREGDVQQALRIGYARWRAAAHGSAASRPVLLDTARGPQPYPLPLEGTPYHEVTSLLAAFAECARHDIARGGSGPALSISPFLLDRLEQAVTQSERRLVRLQAELDGQPDPVSLRSTGDLLLARYAEIPEGASSVTLAGFQGEPVDVRLDPKLAAHENASAYYDRAARSERASQRLPGLIGEAERHRDRLAVLLEGARSGTAAAADITEALPEVDRSASRPEEASSLPYRRYRSSGGLEIRVGRGARQNDDLTFRHSAPGDVWLHARHSAGAHVVLRWAGPGNPPARDLEEAGALAALHSKARTSSSVPVDWTLRKYVRKPRQAAPGAVLPDRVRTIFVRPEPELLERLADPV
jgi:predicted ribosome quality control (RQC) complex YloA/Tae2 family protein